MGQKQQTQKEREKKERKEKASDYNGQYMSPEPIQIVNPFPFVICKANYSKNLLFLAVANFPEILQFL